MGGGRGVGDKLKLELNLSNCPPPKLPLPSSWLLERKKLGASGTQLSLAPFPTLGPTSSSPVSRGRRRRVPRGTRVSHQEEAVTERGSRRTLPGLGGAGREAAARDTRAPTPPAPSSWPGEVTPTHTSLLHGASLRSRPSPPQPQQPPTTTTTTATAAATAAAAKRQKPRATAKTQSETSRFLPSGSENPSLGCGTAGGARLTPAGGSRNRRRAGRARAAAAGRGEPGSFRPPGRARRLRAVARPPRAPRGQPPHAVTARAGDGRPGPPVTSPGGGGVG